MSDTSESFDLIVIGGGRASGLAIAAAKAGWKTAIIERAKLGGACPNNGCVPSKLLIGFAEVARHVRHADRHFIHASYDGADMEKIFGSVNDYVGGVDGRYEGRIEASGATLIRGEARFTGEKTVTVGERTLKAGKIVIATGSRPNSPPFGDLPVWTSESLFPLMDKPPKSLLVIGGGFIGCEMGSFFAGMGTDTTLFVRSGRLLAKEDHEIEGVFQREFEKEVSTHCHASLTDLTHDGEEFTAVFDIHGEAQTFTAERVLFAIGRKPNTDMLNLEETGLETNRRGFIPVNEELETKVDGIYVAGDANGRFMLQHAASHEVLYLRRRLLNETEGPIDESLIGHGVFTYPEVASIGKTEEELKEAKTEYVSVFTDWLASAKAMAMRIDYPRVKLLVSPDDYSILGCHLIGPESATLLHQVMVVMRLKNDVRELANMIYIHPALNECLLSASVEAVGKVRKYQEANS